MKVSNELERISSLRSCPDLMYYSNICTSVKVVCLLRFEMSSYWVQVRSVTSWGLTGRSHRPCRQTRNIHSSGYSPPPFFFFLKQFYMRLTEYAAGYMHTNFPSLEMRKKKACTLFTKCRELKYCKINLHTLLHSPPLGKRWRRSLDTALQDGKSRLRFPKAPLGIFIDLIIPAALGPEIGSTSNRN